MCNVPRNGENLAILVQRQPRRNRRAAVLCAFHHQHPDAHSADNPVPNREILRITGAAHGELRDEQPFLGRDLRASFRFSAG